MMGCYTNKQTSIWMASPCQLSKYDYDYDYYYYNDQPRDEFPDSIKLGISLPDQELTPVLYTFYIFRCIPKFYSNHEHAKM